MLGDAGSVSAEVTRSHQAHSGEEPLSLLLNEDADCGQDVEHTVLRPILGIDVDLSVPTMTALVTERVYGLRERWRCAGPPSARSQRATGESLVRLQLPAQGRASQHQECPHSS